MKVKRFKDHSIYIPSLRLINCLECNNKATLEREDKYNNENSLNITILKIKCDNCGLNLELKSNLDLCIKYYCSMCSKKAERIIMPNIKTPKDNLFIDNSICLKCNNIIKNQDIETIFYKTNNSNLEKYLNYNLWLQGDIKGNIFWAYNYEHLNHLKNFIEAKIREKIEERYFMTITEKLPKFIKSSKNRDRLLKLIEELERK